MVICETNSYNEESVILFHLELIMLMLEYYNLGITEVNELIKNGNNSFQ